MRTGAAMASPYRARMDASCLLTTSLDRAGHSAREMDTTSTLSTAVGWRHDLVALIDSLYGGDAVAAPPGTLPRLFDTLDRLHAAEAEEGQITMVETVAIDVHRLQDALRLEGAHAAAVQRLRLRMRHALDDWMLDQPLASFA